MLFTKAFGLVAAVLANLAHASPLAVRESVSSDTRLVFCHFMIGIVSDRSSPADYDDDMRRAKAYGIDAFALNIGVDPYTDAQLQLAYQSAANNGMKVFISFDFNWYNIGQGSAVGQKIAQYANLPAQLYLDNRPFASSFSGDGVDIGAIRSAAGSNVFFVPNFHPGQGGDLNGIDGALNWMGWDNNGNNKAPDGSGSVSVAAGDAAYKNWLGGKKYLAPVSPWFSTHFGPEVPYSKNWVFPGGSLFYDRWNQVLQQGFDMIEIVTWNDYGESHYIGPLSSKHTDDGNSKWVNDMPHDAFLELSKPYIAAYKAKSTSVTDYITKDQIIYWYRRNLKSLNCDLTDTTSGRPANNASGNYFQGRPNGWESMADEVYVVALMTKDSQVTVTSGGNTKTQAVKKGATLFTVPAGLGVQKFKLVQSGATVYDETSLMQITDVCPCGIYNFNPYTGSVPAGFADPLGPDALASLTVGLHVSTCQATPSLGTVPPTNSAPVTSTVVTTATVTSSGPTTTKTTTAKTTTAMTTTAKPTSTATKTTSMATSTQPPSTGICVAGTVAPGESGNFIGLCQFTCRYGYCPPGPCVCTEYANKGVSPPPSTGTKGCPLPGEGAAYLGLCSFSCDHGYCPNTACSTSC